MDFKKITGAIGSLISKEAVVNPFLTMMLSFLSNILVIAAGSTSTESGHKTVRVVCRLILDLEWKLRESVNQSPSEFDDKILDEFIEACREIEPGYVPVA